MLYHLKNPFHALQTLAKQADYCLINTRITQHLSTKQTASSRLSWRERIRKHIALWRNPKLFEKLNATCVDQSPVAYLLEPRECNNDPTNYWIFTEASLRRLLTRTGWEVISFIRIGNQDYSDPFTEEGNERAVCLVKSRSADLLSNPFL